MDALGLYFAKIRASSRDTATPEALGHLSKGLCFPCILYLLINCTGCITLIVYRIAVSRVVMTTNNVQPLRVLAPCQSRNNRSDIDRKDDAFVVARILDEAVPRHGDRSIACSGSFFKLSSEPVSSRANTAVGISLA